MSYLIKNRDITLILKEKNSDTNEYDIEVGKSNFFVKTIAYDIMPKGAEFFGLKAADTIQWYSSEISIKMTGDSYFSPFTTPTPIAEDKNVQKLYELYKSKFYEVGFELSKYKFFLKIKNCPLGQNLYKGILTEFSFDESDERLGLTNFNISFVGKPQQQDKTQDAITNFFNDLAIG